MVLNGYHLNLHFVPSPAFRCMVYIVPSGILDLE